MTTVTTIGALVIGHVREKPIIGSGRGSRITWTVASPLLTCSRNTIEVLALAKPIAGEPVTPTSCSATTATASFRKPFSRCAAIR